MYIHTSHFPLHTPLTTPDEEEEEEAYSNIAAVARFFKFLSFLVPVPTQICHCDD